MDNLPRATLLKTVSSSPSSGQLPIDPRQGVGGAWLDPLPHVCWLDLVQAAAAADVSSWVHWYCPVQKLHAFYSPRKNWDLGRPSSDTWGVTKNVILQLDKVAFLPFMGAAAPWCAQSRREQMEFWLKSSNLSPPQQCPVNRPRPRRRWWLK